MCWSFGSNTDGQLGVGKGGPEWSNTPVPVELTRNKSSNSNFVTKLAAGAGHSVALTYSGSCG